MSILNVIGMIPKGGRFAKSVVNFVHKTPQNWEKFKSAIQQIDDLLKQGKLKLDGKQKTNFETNKNILKTHEKVTKDAYTQYDKAVKDQKDFIDKSPEMVKDLFKKSSDDLIRWFDKTTGSKKYPPFNVSKTDYTKGWTPTVYERQNLRKIYKDKLNPPERLYTKEMEAIDEELNELMLYGSGKYAHLSPEKKAALYDKLQAQMQKLNKVAMENDPTKLSLSQINKKSQNLQKRIREIADNPNIPGTVTEGPKKDMIAALYDSEHAALYNARKVITKKNSELKYGKKYPVLDPDNDAFIIMGLDDFGHPMKMSRFVGKFSTTKGEAPKGMSFYDKWNPKTGTLRKEGEEVFHETLNSEGKVIMSNPEYKLPKSQNMELRNELYSNLSTSDLAKKGFTLKQVDMIRKGREVIKYLERNKSLDVNIRMHEQSRPHEIVDVMEDLYHRGDDVYKMSIDDWIQKIPEYFAQGGQVPGFATGGISNLFKERQGFRTGTPVKLVKGARWLIRMLKEMMDDMIFNRGPFAKMSESLKMKHFQEAERVVKQLEAGAPLPEELV